MILCSFNVLLAPQLFASICYERPRSETLFLWNSKNPFRSTRRRLTLCSTVSPQHENNLDDTTSARSAEVDDGAVNIRPKRVPWNKGLKMIPGQQCKGRSPEEQQKVEDLRRQRISAANKGRLPWNTGRKHPPETIQRIKERTLEAMKDPKIRDKLRGFQQSLSPDVKARISLGVHEHWMRKLKEIALQKQCLAEWQECIAEAARQGGGKEEVFEWDSYDVEKQQEREEFKRLNEEMRLAAKRDKRVEWTDEHRQRLSEAIRAKWQSEEYRTRVMEALKSRMREIVPKPVVEKKPPRLRSPKPPKPVKDTCTPRPIPVVSGRTSAGVLINEKFVKAVLAGEKQETVVVRKKRRAKINGVAHPELEKSPKTEPERTKAPRATERSRSKTSRSTENSKKIQPVPTPALVPTFVDSQASEKTEKLRQLRANRLLGDNKKKEAAERAKMLMAEAEAAAKALEAIAFKDQFAMASLLETRKLLAEAARSIKAVELGDKIAATNFLPVAEEESVNEDDEITVISENFGSGKRTKRWHCGRLVTVEE